MNVTYAGAGRRLVAVLLDSLIIGVMTYLIGVVAGLLSGDILGIGIAVTNIASFVISIGYFVVYQSQAGQTLGKKVMGVKVVNAEGKTPSMVTFFLREIIGKMVSAIILMIGYLMILWDGRKQGLHDKIAGTFVVKV